MTDPDPKSCRSSVPPPFLKYERRLVCRKKLYGVMRLVKILYLNFIYPMKKIILLVPIITAINFWINYSLDTEKVNLSFQKAEAAWWEFGEAADEYEYSLNEKECTAVKEVTEEEHISGGITVGPGFGSVNGEIGNSTKKVNVPGHQKFCVDGKDYKDCSDALGIWDSILGEGDCVPNE